MTATQARRKACREIAEHLQLRFNLWRKYSPCDWDIELAAEMIEIKLSFSAVEAIEEWNAIDVAVAPPQTNKQPSLYAQLKDALGYHDDTPIQEVLAAALEVVRKAGVEPLMGYDPRWDPND